MFLTKQFFCKHSRAVQESAYFSNYISSPWKRLLFRIDDTRKWFAIFLFPFPDAKTFHQNQILKKMSFRIFFRVIKIFRMDIFPVHFSRKQKENSSAIFILIDSFWAKFFLVFLLVSTEYEYFQLLFTSIWRATQLYIYIQLTCFVFTNRARCISIRKWKKSQHFDVKICSIRHRYVLCRRFLGEFSSIEIQ